LDSFTTAHRKVVYERNIAWRRGEDLIFDEANSNEVMTTLILMLPSKWCGDFSAIS
jgi:hypothetical protein